MYPIDYLWRSASLHPDRIAIACEGATISYRDLARQVIEKASQISSLVRNDGDMVAIGSGNSVDHLISILATLAAGKIWIPLNPRNGTPELKRIIDFTRPNLILADDEMASRIESWNSPLHSVASAPKDGSMRSNVDLGPASTRNFSLERTQAIKFTGGSTGVPKGVSQPMRAWTTCIATQVYEYGLNSNDRFLVAAPLTHGASTYILPVLASGGTLVFPSVSSAAGYLDAIEAFKVSITFAPPTLIYMLTEEQRKKPRRVSTLRYLVYGGAPMPEEKILQVQNVFGQVLTTTFGQTEAPQIITFLPPHEMKGNLRKSVGRPSLLTKVAIVDDELKVLPTGERGEIAVRGELVMSGYFNAPEETEKVLSDGWLRTGDLGIMDKTGCLFIQDRSRDVIISGGFNIYPSDVEDVLSRHPSVDTCCVLGVADEKWGEAAHAAVTLKPGRPFDQRQIIETIKAQIGSVKAPKAIHLFGELPITSVGKISKSAIREELKRRLSNGKEK